MPNRPLALDGPEARTQRTEFARTRRKLMEHEMQGKRQVRFKLDVRSGRQDLSAIRRVGTHALLKQLSRPKLMTEVPSSTLVECACLTAVSIVINKFRIR